MRLPHYRPRGQPAPPFVGCAGADPAPPSNRKGHWTVAKKQDLQSWLGELDAAGDIQHVSGADRETEIGGIVDIYQRKMGRQLLLFDDIPGFQKGYRVAANILTSVPRINRTL